MSRVVETIPRKAPIMQRQWYGTFANAPGINSEAYVILPDFSLKFVWGPCRWQPRVAILKAEDVVLGDEPTSGSDDPDLYATVQAGHRVAKVILPAINDECLVIFDNNRTPWIPVWWPLRGMDSHGYPV